MPVIDAGEETALVLGEFYRRDGSWRFRAVGQGELHHRGPAGLRVEDGQLLLPRPS
ncbi:TerD family protein [Streptomyces sp. LMG1-1-1.1]|uniref:TerD family protein n=1 Tax=Streptomyces sp. LMG1-1-1.1 TaxID=3135245 RepID=UPI0039C9216A